MEELDFYIKTMNNKFLGLLAYFGEENNMPPQDFFTTLRRFILDFVEAREVVERQKRNEEKKEREAAKKATISHEESVSNIEKFGNKSSKVFSMQNEIASTAAAAALNSAGGSGGKAKRRASIM